MHQGVQVLHGGDRLSASATTLVLRSSASKMTHPGLMTLLNVATAVLGYERPRYDFVYMPWAKLAFVNFEDPQSCRAYFGVIQNVCKLSVEHPGISAVAEAYIQGLAHNLAFFISKCGMQAINDPRAPLIFDQGEEVLLSDAINMHVTPQLLAEYRRGSTERVDRRPQQVRWRAVHLGDAATGGATGSREPPGVFQGPRPYPGGPSASAAGAIVFQL